MQCIRESVDSLCRDRWWGCLSKSRTTNFNTNTLEAYLSAQPSSLSAFMNGSQRVHVGWRACRIVCIVAWQNSTRYRDGMKVTRCHSRVVWLVFEGSIPTCTHSENVVSTIAQAGYHWQPQRWAASRSGDLISWTHGYVPDLVTSWQQYTTTPARQPK